MRSSAASRDRHRTLTRVLVVPQLVIWALFAFVPITVKGEPGIDINLALLMVLGSFALVIVSLVAALRSRYFAALGLQLALPVLVLVGHLLVHELRMPPVRDAADYQHLIGQSREAVEEEFGTYGSQVTHRRSAGRQTVLLYYPGLELVISGDGIVRAVKSTD